MKFSYIFILFSFAFFGRSHISVRNNILNKEYQRDTIELLSHHWNCIFFTVNGIETRLDKAHYGFLEIRKSGDLTVTFGKTTTGKWSLLPGKMIWTVLPPDKETLEWMIVALNNHSLKIFTKSEGAEIMVNLTR